MSIINYVHQTKDGSSILVSQMSNDHLLNTIRLISRRSAQVLADLENDQMLPGALGHSMRNEKQRVRQQLLSNLEHWLDKLSPYVFDAARRGLDVSELVQSATGIKGVVAIPESSKLLALVADDEDEDEYYDPNSIQYPL
jgi:hypothetical protein